MNSPKAKITKAKTKIWLRRIFIALAILVLVPLTLFTIGWFNRARIIQVLQERYSENTTGTLSIGIVNASFIDGFPNVGFTLRDITHRSSDTITDQHTTLHTDETKLVISAGNLLRGNFEFKKIEITDATYTSTISSTRSVAYHEQLKLEKQNKQKEGFHLPNWLNHTHASISLNDITFISRDSILNKYFNLHIHRFRTQYKGDKFKIQGQSSMDITVNALGFNTNKGSYFNGAHVFGQPEFSIDLQDSYIDIPSFPFQIDQQTFQLSAHFDLSEINGYKFQLENEHTDLDAVKGLITDSIAAKLKFYDIEKPFESYIKIEGKFQFGNNPDINANFSTANNNISIGEKFLFTDASFKGKLTNDIYDTDSLKTAKKSKKDFKLFFDHITANLKDITVDIRDAYFESTPENLNFFDANIQLHGHNKTLAEIIETDNFDFIGGTFHFDARISGDIPTPYQFVNKASGKFRMLDTRVELKKNGLQLPIQSLAVSLENENATLEELIINLNNGETLVFKGQLTHLSGLLAPRPILSTTSRISLNSPHLNINEILAMANQFLPKAREPNDDRKNLNETLDAVYRQFHPQFSLNIGALRYDDVVINNITSKIELQDPETIVLRNFDFNYNEARTHLKGKVKVHAPASKLGDAIYMDAQAQSEGPISVFKDLFNIELFTIIDGDYSFAGRVNGNVKKFDELLQNTRGDLILSQSILYYAPTESDIAIDSLALKIEDSNIILRHFDLQLDDLSPISLSGSINEFPNFLLDNMTAPGSIDLKIAAPFFDGDALLATINNFDTNRNDTIKENKKALHNVFKDINRFDPEIKIAIDSLKFKDLITERVLGQIYFENDTILKLDHLDINYKQSVAKVHGEVNAHKNDGILNNNPFDLDFYVHVKGKSENLNDYLKTKNFLFRSGDFEFHGNYKAQAKDLALVNPEGFGDLKIKGTLVDYQAADLQIPVDSLHLTLNNDLATLKTLDIQLPGKSKIYFSGSIDNFSAFINNSDNSSHHKSQFSIATPYLDLMDVQQFLFESSIGKGDKKPFDLKNWKEAMRNINTSFYPQIDIQIDTLKHDRLSVTNFGSKLYFDENNQFKIDELALQFLDGTIKTEASVGIAAGPTTPIEIDMEVRKIDLVELLNRVDYFDNEALKEADSVQGLLSYHLQAEAMLDPEGKVDLTSLNGSLQIKLEDLALYNSKPIMDNVPLLSSERFKNLRFRPLVQTFEIKQGELIIPQTEIQSSAIHLFVEGRIKLNHYINIWLSVPWKNLLSSDGLSLPEKTSYNHAGSKFFLQFVKDANSKKARKQNLRIKFKLGNRKLRKMRERE